MKKKIIASLASGLIIASLMVGNGFAASSATAVLNNTKTSRSGNIGDFAQCQTWGKNGPGSSTTVYMYIYQARPTGSFTKRGTRTASPNTEWKKSNTTVCASDSDWYIKLSSSKGAYASGYIQGL